MLNNYDFLFAIEAVWPEETRDKKYDEIMRDFNNGCAKLNERLKKENKKIYFTPIH